MKGHAIYSQQSYGIHTLNYCIHGCNKNVMNLVDIYIYIYIYIYTISCIFLLPCNIYCIMNLDIMNLICFLVFVSTLIYYIIIYIIFYYS